MPKKWEKISLKKTNLRVIDGDIIEAGFNRNGRFSNPEERVLLLYVDTPELKNHSKEKTPNWVCLLKVF